MPDLSSAASDSSGQSSVLVGIIRLWRRNWMRVLVIAALVECCFLGVAWFMTPLYRAEVVLAPQNRSAADAALGALSGQFGGLTTLLGFGGASSGDNEQALAVLRSTAFSRGFILERNLLPVLFADDWDPEAGQWKEADEKRHPTILDGVRVFDRDIRTITVDSQTGIVTLRIEWIDPQQAASWANELPVRLNDDLRRRTTTEAGRSIEFLNRELAGTQVVELRSALSRVLETELKRKMLASVNEEYAFKVVDPAVVSDDDDFVSPNWLIVAIAGLVCGLGLGLLISIVREQVQFA